MYIPVWKKDDKLNIVITNTLKLTDSGFKISCYVYMNIIIRVQHDLSPSLDICTISVDVTSFSGDL